MSFNTITNRNYRRNNNRSKNKYSNGFKPKNPKVIRNIPESELYSELVTIEKHIDGVLTRKQLMKNHCEKLQIEENKLNIRIYNSYENQGANYITDESNDIFLSEHPCWALKIEGSFIENDIVREHVKPFTSYFKKIFIQLDPELYPMDGTIEWNQSKALIDTDKYGFEIKRNGDKDVNVKIFLYLDYNPQQFKVASSLSKVLGVHTTTRSRIFVAFWKYIKKHNLQDPEQRKNIIFNDELKDIFNVNEPVPCSSILDLLTPYLLPPDPIELSYTVKVSGDPKDNVKSYNVSVQDENIGKNIKVNLGDRANINDINTKIENKIRELNNHRKRRDFMLALSEEPIELINNLIASQARDYAIRACNQTEETEYSEFYKQPLVDEATNIFFR
eukprot:TRINITY_DN10782_c0_g1_i1.p1 TRINITY_DN10782_c0_g1~~TRINITY_DN10782_c0_g1_i1.p1  ORF type:complete len:389 (-),score=103.40 TRINITY_DN10782_c0_g1_i1:51-1217(-)